MGKNFHKNPNTWGSQTDRPKRYKRDIFNNSRQYEVDFVCYVGEANYETTFATHLIDVPFISKNSDIDYDKFIDDFYKKYGVEIRYDDLDIMYFSKDGESVQFIRKIHTYGDNIKKLNNYFRLHKIKKLLNDK